MKKLKGHHDQTGHIAIPMWTIPKKTNLKLALNNHVKMWNSICFELRTHAEIFGRSYAVLVVASTIVPVD